MATLSGCVLCGEMDLEKFSKHVALRETELAMGMYRSDKEVCCASCRPAWKEAKEREERRKADEALWQCCVCATVLKARALSKSQRRRALGKRKCETCAKRHDAERKVLYQGLRTESSQRGLLDQPKNAEKSNEEEDEGTWQLIGECRRCPWCNAECTEDHSMSDRCGHMTAPGMEQHTWPMLQKWRMSWTEGGDPDSHGTSWERQPGTTTGGSDDWSQEGGRSHKLTGRDDRLSGR